MSHGGFGSHSGHSGAIHHGGHTHSSAPTSWSGHHLGAIHTHNNLSGLIAQAIRFWCPFGQSPHRLNGAGTDRGSTLGFPVARRLDDQTDIAETGTSKRFLISLLVVALLWGALAGWLATVHVFNNADSENKELSQTSFRQDDSLSSSKTAYGRPIYNFSYGGSDSSMIGQQSFNPAFGLARSDERNFSFTEKSVMYAGRANDSDCQSRTKPLAEDPMLGEVSLPSQSYESLENIADQRFVPGQNKTKQDSPNLEQLNSQSLLQAQQLHKPKAKMILISR